MKSLKLFLAETKKLPVPVRTIIQPGAGAINFNADTAPVMGRIAINKLVMNEPPEKVHPKYASDESYENIENLRKAYATGKKIPPIIIVKLPKIEQGRTHVVVDGHHRVEAARLAGETHIDYSLVPHRNVRHEEIMEPMSHFDLMSLRKL